MRLIARRDSGRHAAVKPMPTKPTKGKSHAEAPAARPTTAATPMAAITPGQYRSRTSAIRAWSRIAPRIRRLLVDDAPFDGDDAIGTLRIEVEARHAVERAGDLAKA